MAIFSTFDPKFQKQILQKSINEYWAENVIHIRKSKLFLRFYIIFPWFAWLVTFVTILSLIIVFIPSNLPWLVVIAIIFAIVGRLIPWCKIAKYVMDYYMDFSIITPQSFIRYDQTWLFKRTSKVIDLAHIRSVSVEKAGFINSLFNNWNIVVLSEWSDFTGSRESKEDAWKVFFRYVKNPEYYTDRIQQMLKNINYNENKDS
jgi:hypothetical protein